MSCVFVSVDVRMWSDEEDFQCSQVSNMDYFSSQSASFGDDVIDKEDTKDGDLVPLENRLHMHSHDSNTIVIRPGESVLYDNVVIENISSDEGLDGM